MRYSGFSIYVYSSIYSSSRSFLVVEGVKTNTEESMEVLCRFEFQTHWMSIDNGRNEGYFRLSIKQLFL